MFAGHRGSNWRSSSPPFWALRILAGSRPDVGPDAATVTHGGVHDFVRTEHPYNPWWDGQHGLPNQDYRSGRGSSRRHTLAADTSRRINPAFLQYSQRALLTFKEFSWPHLTVATLTRPPSSS